MAAAIRYFYSFVSAMLLLLPLALFAQPQVIKVACIGNSVTFGFGHKNPEQTSYPAQLQQLLGTPYLVRNFGHSGATLLAKGHRPYKETKAFAEAIAFAPDIAVIHLGLNDTDPRNWPNYRDEFAADYAALIDALRKANPALTIFVCRLSPIFPDHRRFLSGTRDWFWQIQEQIIQIAKANSAALIDLHTALYNRPDLFPDALHPNEAGAAIISQTVYQKLSGDYGGLQLPPVFASHMVLQRDKPVRFYGKANKGERIKVVFNGVVAAARPDADGNWIAAFPPMKAGGPYKAVISTGAKTVVLDDILIGDVWLCSGQSNMDFPLQSAVNSTNEMKRAQHSAAIRLFNREPVAETVNTAWDSSTLERVNRLQYFSGSWQRCDSAVAKKFSAVAYYFAQQLREKVNIPIGLIQVAVGGAPAESWIDRYTMEHHPVLVNELTNWRQSDFFMPWVRERADTNLMYSTNPKQRHPFEPAYNYEAGIADLTGFPIRGVIWYQGESNAHNIELHEVLLPQLVKSWRKQWGYLFPFYYVQLSSLERPSWPLFRASQLKLLQDIPLSGMAVTSDLGDRSDVHPRRKKEVGDRLASLALHFTYGKKNLVPFGPIAIRAIRTGGSITVYFKNTGASLKTADGRSLRGFSLVNSRGEEKPVAAAIIKDKIVLHASPNEAYTKVLYGWKPYTDASLVNEAGLPASTFQIQIK